MKIEMKTYIRNLLLVLSVSAACTAAAQVRVTELQGFRTGRNNPDIEIVNIHVVPLSSGVLQFYDMATGKPLNGDWHLIVHRRRYLTGNIKNGIAQGDWEEYINLDLYERTTYRDGKVNGKAYRYADRGAVYFEESYDNGTIRERIEYNVFSDGEVLNRITYDENGDRHGHFVSYFTTGNIKSVETWVHGALEGERITYSTGIKTVEHYVDGETSGAYEEWNRAGILTKKGFYEPGHVLTGLCVWFDENGEITDETEYLHGKRHGEQRKYYTGGLLASLTDYDNDQIHGRYIIYDREPHLIDREATYVHGMQHGETKHYYKGELERVSIYRDGEVICEKVYDNGKIEYISLVDEAGSMVRVAEYNPSGQRIYNNPEYKKPSTLTLREDAAGVIDVVFE